MGAVESIADARATAADCFAVASSYGVRLEWDPFIRAQHLMNAAHAGVGVRTWTHSRHGLHMITEYVTYRPPTHMGMRMVGGPPLFRTFSGSWHFTDLVADPGRCRIVFRYRFECRPTWAQALTHPIGRWFLGRDIDRRLAAFVGAVETPDIVARANEEAVHDNDGDEQGG